MTRTISRWNFGRASPIQPSTFKFSTQDASGGKKKRSEEFEIEVWERAWPPRSNAAGPREPWSVRDLSLSQQCEKTALAWEAHNGQLIFHIRQLMWLELCSSGAPRSPPSEPTTFPGIVTSSFLETVERRGNSAAEAGAEDVSDEVTSSSLRLRYSKIPPCVGK